MDANAQGPVDSFVGVLNNGLNRVGVSAPHIQNVIKSVIILLAVYIRRDRQKQAPVALPRAAHPRASCP